MKFNFKYSLVAAALCLTAGAAQAQTATGTVSVTGRITNTPCTLSVSAVTMGDVPISEFESQSTPSAAYRKPFTVTIGGCNISTLNTASLKFSGTQANSEPTTLALTTGTGVASGFGVKIFTNDTSHVATATAVNFAAAGASHAFSIAANKQTFDFLAYYYKFGTVAKPGTANATATVTLSFT